MNLKRIGVGSKGVMSCHSLTQSIRFDKFRYFLVSTFLFSLLFLISSPAFSQAKALLPDFQTVFKHQNIIMLVIEPKTGKIIDANPKAVAFYGYPKSQLLEMTIQQINQLSPEQVAIERQLADTQGRNYFIFRHKLANGEIRTVEVHSEPYQVKGKKLLLSMISDISDQRDRSQELWAYQTSLEKMVDAQKAQIRQEKQRQIYLLLFFILLQMAVIGYLLLDIRRRHRLQKKLNEVAGTLRRIMNSATEVAIVAGDTRGVITEFNVGAEKLLGYKAEELVGQATPEVFHLKEEVVKRRHDLENKYGLLSHNFEVFTLEAQNEGGSQGEWTFVRKDGTQVPVSLVVTPIYEDKAGEIIGYLGIAQDIGELKDSEQALQSTRDQLQATLDAIPDLLFEVDAGGVITSYHTAEADRLYVPPDAFLGKRYQDVLPPKVVAVCNEAFDDARLHGRSVGKQYEMALGSESRYFELSVTCRMKAEDDCQFLVLSRDISERIKAQQHLKLIGNVFNYAREGITITDVNGDIIDVNQGFTDITGYQREEVVGKNPRILKSNLQPADFYEGLWKDVVEKGFWTGEMWNRHKSGEIYAEVITITAVYDDTGKIQNYIGIFSDITAIKENQERLEHIAHYDVLTHLPNRVLLADRLHQAIVRADRNENALAVLFVDLDGFKEVNDLYGHDVGDQVLMRVAERMQSSLREEDTLARLGGDEFVAVLVDLDSVQACEPVLERMLDSICEPIPLDAKVIKLSASIGVTLYPDDLSDADLLVRHADQAMYQAKQEGKNRYRFFDVDQDVEVKTQSAMLMEIRNAIQQNEFVLYYQPKVDLHKEEICGVEALIRWQHPERGLLYPNEFLPVIHDHPLSTELDEWVMKQAMSQWGIWNSQGIDVSISINITARSLLQKDFEDRIQICLGRYSGIADGALSFEILETSALEDIKHVGELMAYCQSLGVSFAIDDFGTGYSSLTYLRHLPAQLIKVDQSFVRDMLVDKDDLAIVNGILKLAQTFEREVLAEGAETIEHCKKLYEMGCTKVQGYAIARPMKPEDFSNWAKVVSDKAIAHISALAKER